MSYTTLFGIDQNCEVTDCRDFRNSWGSAMYVWSAMGKRYLGLEYPPMGDGMKPVWALWKRADIPLHRRAVMAFTFDRVVLDAADFNRLADDMERFVADFPPGEYACSLPQQAAALREMAAEGTYRAACWQQTSMSGDQWFRWVEPPEDCEVCEVDEDACEMHGTIPYNIDTGTEHWFLYAELDKQEVPA